MHPLLHHTLLPSPTHTFSPTSPPFLTLLPLSFFVILHPLNSFPHPLPSPTYLHPANDCPIPCSHIQLLHSPLPISLQLPLLALSLHFQYISHQSLLQTIRRKTRQEMRKIAMLWFLSVWASACGKAPSTRSDHLIREC